MPMPCFAENTTVKSTHPLWFEAESLRSCENREGWYVEEIFGQPFFRPHPSSIALFSCKLTLLALDERQL